MSGRIYADLLSIMHNGNVAKYLPLKMAFLPQIRLKVAENPYFTGFCIWHFEISVLPQNYFRGIGNYAYCIDIGMKKNIYYAYYTMGILGAKNAQQ